MNFENGNAQQTINQVTCNRQVNQQQRPTNYNIRQPLGQQHRQVLGGSPACGRFQLTQAGVDLVRPDYQELGITSTPAVSAPMSNVEADTSINLAASWLDVDVDDCLSSGATSSCSPRNPMPCGQTESTRHVAMDRDFDDRQNSTFGDNVMPTSGTSAAAAEVDDVDAVSVDHHMISFVESFDFAPDNKM
jgi:hypothetical protein